ncbi:MAG TPA: peptidoglycan editing factor PgeF [Methylococcaceae bacterium]|nr:peptidoglycan editing factor PgeF [Methylococcaceae bacterium]
MNSTKHWLKPDWPAPANVFAVTTFRSGGFSIGSFQSFNLAMHVGDNPEQVLKNRQRIIDLLDLPNAPVWLNQVHGKTVVDAAQVNTLVEADASFSHEPGVVCTVLTADCLPVLLCSRDGRSVAAIHAGWRGLLAGVITETVKAMETLDLLVWLGPAIGPNAFEVGDDVRAAFVESNARYADGFRAAAKGKWLADIYCLARINLALAGIESVYGGQFCTLTDVERFYSFRRDKETGRMASLIWRI